MNAQLAPRAEAELKPRVLIADDDGLVLATFAMGLGRLGYRVTRANGGIDAVEQCRKSCPDLALLDVRMPDLGGVEAARQIRSICNVPIMFLSAYDDRDVVEVAVREGALGYLVKPIEPAQAAPAIEAALARAKEIRGLKAAEQSLATALQGNRAVSVAVGILMERHRLDSNTAFERLRRMARTQQRRIESLASDVVAAAELLRAETGETAPRPRTRP